MRRGRGFARGLDRHVAEGMDVTGPAIQDRGVVFAAAVRADAAAGGECAERQAVLDRSQISGQIEPRVNLALPFSTPVQAGEFDERRPDADHER